MNAGPADRAWSRPKDFGDRRGVAVAVHYPRELSLKPFRISGKGPPISTVFKNLLQNRVFIQIIYFDEDPRAGCHIDPGAGSWLYSISQDAKKTGTGRFISRIPKESS